MDYLADTTFLIDLWREQRSPGRATRFAAEHAHASFGLPWLVKAEFLRGVICARQDEEAAAHFVSRFVTVFPTEITIRRYATLYAGLKRRNQLIGPSDSWIAACAGELELPLLTRNVQEFGRVPEMVILDYSKADSKTSR